MTARLFSFILIDSVYSDLFDAVQTACLCRHIVG